MNLSGLEKEFEQEHLKRISRLVGGVNINLHSGDPRSGAVNRILLRGAETLSKDIKKFRLKEPRSIHKGAFYRANAAIEKQIARTLRTMSTDLETTVRDAIVSAWDLNNEKWDDVVDRMAKGVKVPTAVMASMRQLNYAAMGAFIDRKMAGIDLSDRVWNLVGPNKELIEQYLGSGIAMGRSAQKISLDIREMLREPHRLFRRVRDKTGKLRLSAAAKAYHPGSGAYRSSFKNAMRLAVTETNMAYRMSDCTRRQQLPFVLGIRVNLSKSHPRWDICDSMAGDYPPAFVFSGWHPWCLCYTTSILMDKDEFVRYARTGKIDGRRYIRSAPRKSQEYLASNLPKLRNMENRPFWFDDNFTMEGTLRKAVAKRERG